MRVLVTGAAGFIGSHLVQSLVSDGIEVIGMDNFDTYYSRSLKEANLAPSISCSGFRFVEADIRSLSSLKALKASYDAIVHLAARAGVRTSIADPLASYEANIAGTQNLLECAKMWGIKQFVFASSSSVYGVNACLPWDEDELLLPVSPYAATKAACELMGHVYSSLYDVRFIALRLFTVYGPRQRPDLGIQTFSHLMLTSKPITLYGDGSSRRDYTYISDVNSGIRAALQYRGAKYAVINLGSGRPISLSDVIAELESNLDRHAMIDWRPAVPGDIPQTWAKIAKAKQLLNWAPSITFPEGIRRYCRWLLDQNEH